MAVADFFNAPDIDEVDVSAYTGAIGSTIRIKVRDDFSVQRVIVRIENSDTTLVEQGIATPDADGLHYTYTATVANTSLPGDKITATDRPQNETESVMTL